MNYIYTCTLMNTGSVSYRMMVTGATSEFINIMVLYLISIYTPATGKDNCTHKNDGSLAFNQFSSSHSLEHGRVEQCVQYAIATA